MSTMRCVLSVVIVLSVSVWALAADLGHVLKAEIDSVSERPKQVQLDLNQNQDSADENHVSVEVDGVSAGVDLEEDSLSVSERLELINNNLEWDEDIAIEDGDVAVPRSHVRKRNADRCVTSGCKWPRAKDGKVYVPYIIANHYSSSQLDKIKQAFSYFAQKTCIRFITRCNQQDYLYIHSSNGCWSYIGRTGNKQSLSLQKNGCVFLGTIQHELLHALGFHHEHKRSDRDHYIRVLWDNIIKGASPSDKSYRKEHNFEKMSTVNLGTPYDYNSVMHYSREAFSKNGRPTLMASVPFGRASHMSKRDIKRVNRLYCS